MAPLPLAKLAGLLIKTLSKPVAKRIKSQMIKYDVTRDGLIWVGQSTHVLTTRMTIWSSGYKVRSINPLEEGEALSRGADILSESFIFFVSGAIVVYEYHRSSEKEKLKEAARLQKIRDDASILQAKLVSLDRRLDALEEYAKANRKSILGLDIGANYKNPDPNIVVPIDTDEIPEKEKEADSSSSSNNNNNGGGSSSNNDNTNIRARRWFWRFA
ncbi:hypothetical protein ACHAXN_011759 [Cyclotella atomus]